MTKTDPPTQTPTLLAPTIIELTPAPTIQSATSSLAHLPGCLLLQSAMKIEQPIEQSEQQSDQLGETETNQSQPQSQPSQPLGRYSFLMADPIETVVEPVGSEKIFARLRSLLEKFSTQTVADLPPMQGGLAGMFSYDLNRSIERVAPPRHDEFELPAIAVGAYDVVVAWDHLLNKSWIISQGFPAPEPDARRLQAQSRARFFECLLEIGALPNQPLEPQQFELSDLAPAFDVSGPEDLKSNFAPDDYIDSVQKSIDYINAGDVFQINLAQRLLLPANCSSLELHFRLAQCNPAPFGGYFDLSGLVDKSGFGNHAAQIISASPERLFSVRDGIVETRPIKGTRRRTGRPMVDIKAKEELLASQKDQAENTMIVDLMRNAVTQHCKLEEYQSVFHLVSAVQGRLKPEHDLIDLLQSVFPGGSITGAPKVRAMEIISQLEPTARGAYCGALGYLGFDGNADLNILIRTITASGGWWQIPVGGGIVTQSDPTREYEETWTKAAGMLRAATMKDGEPK